MLMGKFAFTHVFSAAMMMLLLGFSINLTGCNAPHAGHIVSHKGEPESVILYMPPARSEVLIKRAMKDVGVNYLKSAKEGEALDLHAYTDVMTRVQVRVTEERSAEAGDMPMTVSRIRIKTYYPEGEDARFAPQQAYLRNLRLELMKQILVNS